MGYLVPDTKQQMDDAFLYDLRNVLAQYNLNSAAMENLIHAYHMSSDIFERNQDQFYQSLYETFQAFGIGNGASQEKLFPPADRSLEHFKNTFQKLWKAASVYAELTPFDNMAKVIKAMEGVTLPNTASVAEIYEHYDDRYDRILMEQDMLKEVDHRMESDMVLNPIAESLKTLNTFLIFHTTDAPFSDAEKEKIRRQTSRLNEPFRPEAQTEDRHSGLFCGDRIETPADLKQYLERYEAMLCEFMKKDQRSFRKFAQSYQEPEQAERRKKLTEAEIYAARRKNAAADLDAEFECLIPELDKFKNNKLKESAASVCEQYLGDFHSICQSMTNTILGDSHVKDAEAELKKSYKEAIAEQQKCKDEYNVSFIDAHGDEEKRKLIDEEHRQLGELLRNQEKALDDAKNISRDTKAYEPVVYDAVAKFKKAVREYRKETTDKQFMQELSDSRNQFYKTFKEIKAERKKLQAHPDEEKQRLLDEKAIRFTKLLEEKLEAFDRHQSDAEQKLKTVYKACMDQVEKAYLDEQKHWLGRVNQSINTIKERREKFSKEEYPNNSYVKRMNSEEERKRQEAERLTDEKERVIRDELRDICDALGSVKKTNLFGNEKDNSEEYNTMLEAIEAYQTKQLDAETAYQACADYLALSLDSRGGVKNMGSKLGKLRKQACVRMMELLKPEAALDADELEDNEYRQRINYETLKASLARKSTSIDANQNDGNAKAYSDLNAKISEVKKARNREL